MSTGLSRRVGRPPIGADPAATFQIDPVLRGPAEPSVPVGGAGWVIAPCLTHVVPAQGLQYIAPGSPWENGYCERFNGKLQDECMKQEIFTSLKEAQVVIGIWRNTYNRVRPHSSLNHRPPAPVTFPDTAFRLPKAATMQ